MNTDLLVEAIDLRASLEAEIEAKAEPYKAKIAPLKAELELAVGGLRAPLAEAKKLETAFRHIAEAEYQLRFDARRKRLLAGEEVPPIPTPGLGVTWREELVQDGTTDLYELFKLDLLVPDLEAIEARLKAGEEVPGYRIEQRPSFRRKRS